MSIREGFDNLSGILSRRIYQMIPFYELPVNLPGNGVTSLINFDVPAWQVPVNFGTLTCLSGILPVVGIIGVRRYPIFTGYTYR